MKKYEIYYKKVNNHPQDEPYMHEKFAENEEDAIVRFNKSHGLKYNTIVRMVCIDENATPGKLDKMFHS